MHVPFLLLLSARQYFSDPESVPLLEDTPRLRFFDECERYVKEVSKNKTARRAYSDFRDGPEMLRVLAEVVEDNNLEELNLTTSTSFYNPRVLLLNVHDFPL